MRKRLCALVLICAVGMVLQGCGSKNETTDSKKSENAKATTEAQETTTEETTTEAAKEETTESQQATTEAASAKTTESQKESMTEAQKESTTEAQKESTTEAQEVDPLNMNVTKEQAYDGVNNYCHSNYDWSVAEDDPSIMYVEMGEETEEDYLVIFHSYTGSIVYFNVDKRSGRVNMSEYVPSLDVTDQAGSFNLFEYLK